MMTALDLWVLALDQPPDRVRELRAWLSPEECGRADAFATNTLRSRWTVARGGLRLLLGRHLDLPPAKVQLTTTKSGKPILEPDPDALHFNLAHCDSHAAYAFSREFPVGVDLEDLSRETELQTCLDAFCHPDELAIFANRPATPQALLRLWCAKEATLKAAGTGFQIEPSKVLVTGWNAGPLTARWPGSDRKNWHITFPETQAPLCLAVATPKPISPPVVQTLHL